CVASNAQWKQAYWNLEDVTYMIHLPSSVSYCKFTIEELDHAGSFTRSLGHFFRQLPSEDIEREKKKKKKSREMGRDQASVRRILTVKTED
ncbi:hypothetical protein B296_00046068, partial [Ensete ventricosum]